MPDLTVSRGLTYHYQHFPPSLPNAEYVLFFHGWPSAANDWHNQIDHFRKLGWGVLAPDLLGAGRTSRPAEADKYVLKDMARDVVEILDHEKISKVHAVGHDWGSFLLSRFAVYYPERTNKLCFIAVGYRPPGAPFDLEAAHEVTTKIVGYPTFGYQIFFIQHEKAQDLLNEHKDSIMSLMFAKDPMMWKVHFAPPGSLQKPQKDSIMSLMFAKDPMMWKVHFAPPGSLQKYLESDQQVEWATYLTEVDRQNYKENISDELGGVPSLNWYKANGSNLNYDAEKDTTEEQRSLKQPTLLINCTQDAVGVPVLQTLGMKPFVPRLEIQELNTAHWAQIEAPEAVNAALEKFFRS